MRSIVFVLFVIFVGLQSFGEQNHAPKFLVLNILSPQSPASYTAEINPEAQAFFDKILLVEQVTSILPHKLENMHFIDPIWKAITTNNSFFGIAAKQDRLYFYDEAQKLIGKGSGYTISELEAATRSLNESVAQKVTSLKTKVSNLVGALMGLVGFIHVMPSAGGHPYMQPGLHEIIGVTGGGLIY